MGRLVDGQWTTEWYQPDAEGRFVRPETSFRHWITADGPFTPAEDRYHLYVSLACPWAHRTLIMRTLKGLESMITVSVVNPYMRDHGWTFVKDEGVVADPIFNRSEERRVGKECRARWVL